MDPSEFEGTVERSSDALTLTSLEELLDNAQPKFIKLDLEKESDELYVSVFKVKEALKKWDEVSLANLRLAWDEQAIKIAELKEEVSARKKTLAGKIRQFTNRHLVSGSEDGEEEEIVMEGKDLVAAFKSEFDFVNTSSRFAETAFLSTYKILRGNNCLEQLYYRIIQSHCATSLMSILFFSSFLSDRIPSSPSFTHCRRINGNGCRYTGSC